MKNYNLQIITERLKLKTDGNIHIIDITDKLSKILLNSNIKEGIMSIFVPGATGGITTMEYEKELLEDTKEMFKDIVKEDKNYRHNKTHSHGNATSHLRATLIGPSLTLPITNGKIELGIWQQVVFIDFDNRPRDRELVIKIIGV